MLIRITFVFSLLALGTGAVAQNLDVRAGETKIIQKSEEVMTVRNVIMGDNSKIVLAPDVRRWQITAETATFGANTLITGTSPNGVDGKRGADGVPYGGDCTHANPGSPGEAGTPGVNGRSIFITTGISDIGSLRVESNGGDGGNGGNGGNGRSGGNGDCSKRCNGGDGGSGGKGGKPGAGGDGGDIIFNYYWLTNTPPPKPDDQIVLVAEAGAGGKSGGGGDFGRGGAGQNCSGTNNRDRGSDGTPGAVWPDGAAGHIGLRQFNKIDKSSVKTAR